MSHVFISYVRNNQRRVKRLCKDLEAHGVTVWLDRKNIGVGRWKQAIRKAIQEGAFFIACFSKEYNDRSMTYMNEELTLAIDIIRQRSIDQPWFIPVKLSPCEIPDRGIGGGETLRDFQYFELYKCWDDGIKQILNVIKPIPSEVQNFIQALQSTREEVRYSAAEALCHVGIPAVVPDLIKALNDEVEVVRAYVVEALGRIGDARAVPALIEALLHDKDKGVRHCAAKALGEIGEPAAVSPLIEALSDKNEEVRLIVAWALNEIRKKAARS